MSDTYKIETGIKPKARPSGTRWADLADNMSAGTSVLLENATANDVAGLRVALKVRGKKVKTEKEGSGYRVFVLKRDE